MNGLRQPKKKFTAYFCNASQNFAGALHETLDLLAEAKAEASVVWEEDERENAQE